MAENTAEIKECHYYQFAHICRTRHNPYINEKFNMNTNQEVSAYMNGELRDSAFTNSCDSAQQEYNEDAAANTSLELLEQHQAKEQARLLQRFRELREWQQQQQQQLMLQQQQQLKAWQDEQSKVQSLIAGSQSKVLRPHPGGSLSPRMTPPSKPYHGGGNNVQKDHTRVSQSQGAGISLDSGLVSMQDTLKSQGTLPKPVMYLDPSKSLNANDEDKYTSSELFSNPPALDDQLDILKEDDARPVPDWMSDSSDNFVAPRLPPPRPVRGGNGVNQQLAGLEHLLQTAPAGLLQQVLNLLPGSGGNRGLQSRSTDEIERSASPTLLGPGEQPRARKLQFQQPPLPAPSQAAPQPFALASFQDPPQQQQHPQQSSHKMRQQQQHQQPQQYSQHLKQQQQQLQQMKYQQQQQQQQQFVPRNGAGVIQNFQLGPTFEDPEDDPRFIPRAVMLNYENLSDEEDNMHQEENENEEEWQDENSEEEASDDDEEEDDDGDQNITTKEVQNVTPDERPIQGTAGKKTFEQLLEEQLQEEQAKLHKANQEASGKSAKQPFLRKGEGISRFSSAPKKPVKKPQTKANRKPSQSQQEHPQSKDTVKSKEDSAGGSSRSADSGDGNKKSSVGSRLKDMSQSGGSSKAVERKIKSNSKNSTRAQEMPAGQERATGKLKLIHSAASKRMEEQRCRQKEQQGNTRFQRAEMDHIDLFRTGGVSAGVERSPSLDSRSVRSDDHDSTELDSLAEFELLEDAMDNISFCSNSSLVKKLVNNDKADHKEAVTRLKTISDIRKTREESSGQAETDQSKIPMGTEKDSRSTGVLNVWPEETEEEIAPKVNGNSNNSNNNNNDSNEKIENIHLVEPTSDSSDVTLTDTSDEENDAADPSGVQNGPASNSMMDSQAGSRTIPPQSPSKVMTRKVAPLASKFASANDTLSVLKALSVQAGILTSGNAVSSNSGNTAPFFPSMPSSTSGISVPSKSNNSQTSNFPAAFATTASSSHHSIHPSSSYLQSPSQFSGLGTLPSDFKFNPFFLQDGANSQSSTALTQNNWFEAKPVISNMPSVTFSGETSNFVGFQMGMNGDQSRKGLSQGKMYNSNRYGSQIPKDNEDEDSDDDDNEDSKEDVEYNSEEDNSDTNEKKLIGKEDMRTEGDTAIILKDVAGHKKTSEEGSEVSPAVHTAFDDEMAWVDDDDDDDDDEDQICLKTAGTVPATMASTTTSTASTPPTSKLVSRLFPKLKPKPSAEAEKAQQNLQQATAQPVQTTDGIQSRILRDKLMELDTEIERFRSENANLEKLRREREEGLTKLKQEIESFQQEKEKELKRLEEFKAEEMKKLKRERKLFDSYQKKVRSMPDKKEREEIETLKTQLQELQDELKRKESRWNASTARLKNRLAEVELENGELKEEIRILEKKRLEWMSAQASAKPAVSSNGKTGHGDSGVGKTEHTIKQPASTQPRSSTPTQEVTGGKDLGPASQRNSFPQAGAPLRSAIPTVTSASHSGNGGAKAGKITPTGSGIVPNGYSSDGARASVQNGTGSAPPKQPVMKTTVKPINHVSLSSEGLQTQNNAVPVMMENTLPVGTQAASMPGSLASSVNPSDKSAALMAMERAVVDKGDPSAFVETRHQDGKIEKTYKTGAKEIHFPNGTVKEISADGQTIVCRLANGDIRQIFPDHRVVYIFSEAQIMQTTFPDGLETFQFKNGQIERRYPDGTVEITFPSKDVKYLFPDGGQEVILTDGTVMQYNSNGERTIEYPSGDREVHTAEYQRREFPDGIIKTVYSDGRHETRFPNGRVRMRDKAGNVIMDQIVYR